MILGSAKPSQHQNNHHDKQSTTGQGLKFALNPETAVTIKHHANYFPTKFAS